MGLGIGGVYGLAQLLQTWGLASTSASVSGFLTGAYVVFTPFVAFLVVRSRVTGRTLLASVIALVGIAVLSLTGLAMGGGETLTLLSAVVYALHIVLVGRFAQHLDTLAFTTFQMLGITVVVGDARDPRWSAAARQRRRLGRDPLHRPAGEHRRAVPAVLGPALRRCGGDGNRDVARTDLRDPVRDRARRGVAHAAAPAAAAP